MPPPTHTHTHILQDCLVGLLFAFMPVLAAAGGSSGFDVALLLSVMGHVVAKLAVLALGALAVSRTVLPPAMRALARRFGPDSFQLAAIAFCLLCALGTARQGISPELGAFVAGVMLSATEQQDAVLHHLGEQAVPRCSASRTVRAPRWPAVSVPHARLGSCTLRRTRGLLDLRSLVMVLHSCIISLIPSAPSFPPTPPGQSPSPSSSSPSSSPPPAWC